jgi:hypothetical protein
MTQTEDYAFILKYILLGITELNEPRDTINVTFYKNNKQKQKQSISNKYYLQFKTRRNL